MLKIYRLNFSGDSADRYVVASSIQSATVKAKKVAKREFSGASWQRQIECVRFVGTVEHV